MTRLCIAGIGSPFGDDRAGWDVLDAIKASKLKQGSAFDTVRLVRATPVDLPWLLAQADAAILIDAMDCGATPGSWQKIDITALRPPTATLSSHGIGMAEALALIRTLGWLPDALLLYGVQMGSPAALARDAAGGTTENAYRATLPALTDEILKAAQKLLSASHQYASR